jgi:acyl-CoA reductase-like NAD-dependent aldehyde dehydrogenase
MIPVMRVLSSIFGAKKPMIPAVYGEKPEKPRQSSSEEIHNVVETLESKAKTWRALNRQDKAKLFLQCIDSVCEHGAHIAEVSTRAKGQYGQGCGEEFLGLIPIVTYLSEVAECFNVADGVLPPPYSVNKRETLPSGDQNADIKTQMIVDVAPLGLSALALGGFRGELWITPGYEVTQGRQLRQNEEESEPGVGLVLGAGNHYPLAVLDILHVLALQSRVVLCKMNPVNEYMGPLLRLALAPLVERGFVDIVYGGAEVGQMLVDDPAVKSIHLTGSETTYDNIVWRGKDKMDPRVQPALTKYVGAELGCVTPYIIVPGEWDAQTIEYHAANVISGTVHNAGHNCLGCEVIVTDASWPQREEFLGALERLLDSAYKRTAYYPGSKKRFERFDRLFPDCKHLGQDANAPSREENGSHFPWMLKTGLTPTTCAVNQENWCGVLQEVALNTGRTSVESFFQAAASFTNDACWGSLSCCVLVDDGTMKNHKDAFSQLITDLEYGFISVNVPCQVGFGLTRLSWGAWGDDADDRTRHIGSGNVKVHNSQFFDHVQKSVLYAPSNSSPPPFWHVTSRNVEKTAAAALAFFKSSKVTNLLKLINQAVQG